MNLSTFCVDFCLEEVYKIPFHRYPEGDTMTVTSVHHEASTISSAINLIKTIIGAGLLSMPYSYSTDGSVVGTIIILMAAITSGYGLFLQGYVSRYAPVGHATFFNICSISYPSLSVVFDTAIAVQCFGCAISYLVLVGDLMPTIVPRIPYIGEEHYRTFWILASTVICVPLSFMKNLSSLKYTSVLGLVAIFYMALLVITHFLVGDIPKSSKGEIRLFPANISDVFSTFSIAVFAFTGHQNMFSIINEAKDKSMKAITKLINLAIIVSAGLFIIVGLTGYLTFGDKVNGNVILLYPNSITTSLGRFCIVFMVIFSFPLMLHPARISVNNIFYTFSTNVKKAIYKQNDIDDEQAPLLEESHDEVHETGSIHEDLSMKATLVPFSHTAFLVMTTLLLLLGYTLAITIKSFAFVLAVIGATGSTAISFILPGLFGYKLIGTDEYQPTKTEYVLKTCSLALVGWGFGVMTLCLYTTLFMNNY